MKKKVILIVGGTGFIGFHLAKFFLKKKFRVISVSRKKPKKIRFLKRVNYIFVNIYNKKKLTNHLKNLNNIDYAINAGGEVEHKLTRKVYQSHFIGVKNIAEILLKHKLKKFIQIGSSLEYGKRNSPHFEKYKEKPNSSYAKAKLLATNYLISLSKKKSFPAYIIRPYQIYGPYQDINRFVPFVIKNCLDDKIFPASHGKQKRDFLFIEDFINCVFKLVNYKKRTDTNGEVFNIGFGKPEMVKNVIKLIYKIIQAGNPEFGKIKLRKEENMITFPSINKIKKFIDWSPKIKLTEGIKKTIEFYRKKKI